MNINEAFPSKFIKAADLQGRPVVVKIATVKIDEVEKGKQKPILHFIGKDRGLALNVVNKNKLVELFGPETDHWTGKPIELFSVMTDFQGQTVEAIRIRAPRPAAGASPAAPTPPPANEPPPYDDSEVPF